jgi:dTDP-4-dehydrorhamnose reductase
VRLIPRVDLAETEKVKTDAVNNTGAKNLAEAAISTGSRLIHISTDYVFDGKKKTPYTEDDEKNPLNEYGLSKLKGEEAIKNSGASYLIIRTGGLYGKNGNNFVNTILKLADSRKKIEVVNDQFITPTYTKDLAYALSEIIMKDNSKNETYHLTNGGHTSWYEFAIEIIKVFKRTNTEIIPISSDKLNRPAKRPHNSILDNSKIKEDFSISLRHWKDALKKYCNDIGYFIR